MMCYLVMARDYRRVLKIYGLELGSLRDKTTRRKSDHMRIYIITPIPG